MVPNSIGSVYGPSGMIYTIVFEYAITMNTRLDVQASSVQSLEVLWRLRRIDGGFGFYGDPILRGS